MSQQGVIGTDFTKELPVDLCEMIFKFTNKSDLANCAVLNKLFYSLTVLNRHIQLACEHNSYRTSHGISFGMISQYEKLSEDFME